MSSDTDDEIFLTQTKFSQDADVSFDETDIYSEFQELIDSDSATPNFVIEYDSEKSETKVGNDSSDEDLVRVSQQIENEFSNRTDASRFGKPLTDEEFMDLQNMSKNKNTEKKCQWAIRIFDSWYKERKGRALSFGQTLLKFSDEDLCKQLVLFVTEVKNQKGAEYHGNTIHEILMSIQYFLRENGRDVNFNADFEFAPLRKMLDAKMRSLAQSGIGIHKRKADVITREQEDLLWQKGILGDDTPQKLLDTMFYINGICFCLRGGDEHHSLKIGESGNFNIVIKNDQKHLKYSEGVTKTNNGGLKHKNVSPKCVAVAENKENPQRCPVRIYEKYMSLRPSGCGACYVRALKYPKPDMWYCSVAVGRHTLSRVVRRLCEMAGLKGFFTNHSLRATRATRLYESGIDEQLIAERTGHRSSAIREYKRTSDQLLKAVDDVVQNKRRAKAATSAETPCTSRQEISCTSLQTPQTSRATPISFTVERKGTRISLNM